MTRSLCTAITLAAFALFGGTAHAAAKTASVKNVASYDIKVLWTANGCAGVVDGRTFVCHSKVLAPGQEAKYEFKWGTTWRTVKAVAPRCSSSSAEITNEGHSVAAKMTVGDKCAFKNL